MEKDDELSGSLTELLESGDIAENDAAGIRQVLEGKDEIDLPGHLTSQHEQTEQSEDIRAKLNDMTLPEKIKLAMFGNAVARMLLIVDANRMVQECVLKNPQLRDTEIADITKNKNVSEYVLRFVSGQKGWTKSYAVKLNLVSNPKTPPDVSMKWLRHLRVNDLRRLAKSKEVPQLVATTAQKRVAEAMKKR